MDLVEFSAPADKYRKGETASFDREKALRFERSGVGKIIKRDIKLESGRVETTPWFERMGDNKMVKGGVEK
jgi:hypothetical protein